LGALQRTPVLWPWAEIWENSVLECAPGTVPVCGGRAIPCETIASGRGGEEGGRCEFAPHWAGEKIECGTLRTHRKWGRRERRWEHRLGHHTLPTGCVIDASADAPRGEWGAQARSRHKSLRCCPGEPCKADAWGSAHPGAQPHSDMSYVPTGSSLAKQVPWVLCKSAILRSKPGFKLKT